jgi:hypothetical protein
MPEELLERPVPPEVPVAPEESWVPPEPPEGLDTAIDLVIERGKVVGPAPSDRRDGARAGQALRLCVPP